MSLDILFLICNGPKHRPLVEVMHYLPPGVGYLASVLKEVGFSCDVLDYSLDGITVNTLVRELLAEKPMAVGFSALTEGIELAKSLSSITQAVSPQSLRVLGGAHGTFLARSLLDENSFDIAVHGEAEGTLVELLTAIKWQHGSLDSIPGLTFRRNSEVIATAKPTFHRNLDELPFPDRRLFGSAQYYGKEGIVSARGCPFECVFCSAPALSERAYRLRSAESVFDEVAFLSDTGVRFFTFLDDLTTLNRARLLKLCALIQKSGIRIEWACESRVDVLSPELCQTMFSAGCCGIHFGVESGNDETLKAIGKKIRRSDILAAAEMANRAAIQVICSFIVGHPNESRAQIERTFAFARELHERYGAVCLFSVLTPFPGTDLYNRHEAYGVQIHARSFTDYSLTRPMISTAHLTLSDLKELMAEAREVESYTMIARERRRKQLERNLEPCLTTNN